MRKPKREFRAYTFGRTEIQVEPNASNEREDAYFVAPQAMKAEHPALHGVFVRYYRQDPAAEAAGAAVRP